MRSTRFGFTLIEVMVVIVVFSIGVLALLRMVSSNIAVADTVRLKTMASFLAKESMSLAFNIRDTNRLAGLPWDCVINYTAATEDTVCSDYLISGQQSATARMLGVNSSSFLDIHKIQLSADFPQNFAKARLGLFSGSQNFPVMYYGTGSDAAPTYFSRYIRFVSLLEDGVLIPSDKLVKIESHVLYSKGGNTGEVVLESFIGNY